MNILNFRGGYLTRTLKKGGRAYALTSRREEVGKEEVTPRG